MTEPHIKAVFHRLHEKYLTPLSFEINDISLPVYEMNILASAKDNIVKVQITIDVNDIVILPSATDD